MTQAESTIAETNLDKDLLHKAELLRNTHLFMHPTTIDEVPLLVEKQMIFLVLAGFKPVSEASSGELVKQPDGQPLAVPSDRGEIARFLDTLGLRYHIRGDEYATDALVSLKQELIDEYLDTEGLDNAHRIGELFGYPKTATDAFGDKEQLLSIEEQDRLVAEGGLDEFMNFRCSRDHWREEFQAVKAWADVLRAYGLANS